MPPTMKIWIASLIVLMLKMHFNSIMQQRGRNVLKTSPRPEDAAMFGGEHREDTGLAWRAGNCWRNDLENIPLYLFIALAYVFVGGSQLGAYVLFGVYTAARISHTVCYMRALQPWRGVSFAVGQATLLTITGFVIYKTFIA